jgi:hypothetical protein
LSERWGKTLINGEKSIITGKKLAISENLRIFAD